MKQWQTAVWYGCSNFASLPFCLKQLTQLVKLTPGITGKALRLVLMNRYGNEDLVFSQVTVADNPEMTQAVRVTINGQSELTIPRGQVVRTDPVRVASVADQPLYVMMVASRSQRYADFNSTYDPTLANAIYSQALHFRPQLPTGDHARKGWFCLAGMEVLSGEHPLVVELTGDSLAEMGLVATSLVARLRRQLNRHVVLCNTAISGSRLLHGASNDEPLYATFGDSLISRIAGESFPVDLVVALIGSNDLLLPFWSRDAQLPTAKQLVDGFDRLNQLVQRRGSDLITTTIPPVGLHLANDQRRTSRHVAAIRHQVNRQLATRPFVVEVEPLISTNGAWQPGADFGDQLHYSAAGANLVASAILSRIDDKMSLLKSDVKKDNGE